MFINERVTRRYSEGLGSLSSIASGDFGSISIWAELSTGKFSKSQLSNISGLRLNTINDWIKKYARKDIINTRIMLENQDEISRIKVLQKEIE